MRRGALYSFSAEAGARLDRPLDLSLSLSPSCEEDVYLFFFEEGSTTSHKSEQSEQSEQSDVHLNTRTN